MSDEEDILRLATQRIGTVLHGKYRLDAVVGVGGMAVVYAATHRNQKQFAVKVLRPEFSVRSEFRARFLREGYAANSVKHAGVVAVLDDDVDEAGTAFLVLELLQGADVELLRSRSGGKLAVQLALTVAHEVLSVLDAAHAQAVVHRDLKPANLFIVESGQVKVLDFGIARLREAGSNTESTRSGALLGTPAFMTPEQALAQSGGIDARTDLWALGASLFTMLSGQFVHEAENGRQTMIRAATAAARSLASAAPELPASVVELVDRALKFDPAERWQSASVMRVAVAKAHRELFGELSLLPLQACVKGFGAPRYLNPPSPRLSPSVASALGKSETTAATPTKPTTLGHDGPRPRPQPAERERRRGPLIAGLAAVLLGAVLLTCAWLASSARPGTSARLSPARPAAQAAAAFAAPSHVTPSVAAAPAPSAALEVKLVPPKRPRAMSLAPKAVLAKLAFNPAAPPQALGASVARAPASTATPDALAPGNPLELKLQ